MSLKIKFGNFLFKYAFSIYKPLYKVFKNKQDAFEIDLLKKHIQKNNVVLDIGANIGFYAAIISKIVGENGKVICFEPDITNFNYLKENTKRLNKTENNLKIISLNPIILIKKAINNG